MWYDYIIKKKKRKKENRCGATNTTAVKNN